ncbi:hypothetical protein Ciccas_008005 [Cichlidogyrus casuarinus]|uniref:Uncharacterized protein n=1 Tax=Cichlidogyrus casuarinus TaxID=1844966 RepID=A0ABD2Q188_9PLAT
MEMIYSEFTNGHNSSLMSVLDSWEARYANEYNILKDEYNQMLDDGIFDCLPSDFLVDELDLMKRALEAELDHAKTKSAIDVAAAESRAKVAEQALIATSKALSSSRKIPSIEEVEVKQKEPEPSFTKLRIGFSGDSDDQFLMSNGLESDDDLDDFCSSLMAKATAMKKSKVSILTTASSDMTVTPINSQMSFDPLNSSTPHKDKLRSGRLPPNSPTRANEVPIELKVSSSPIGSDVEEDEEEGQQSSIAEQNKLMVPRADFDKLVQELNSLKMSRLDETQNLNVTRNLQSLKAEVLLHESACQVDEAHWSFGTMEVSNTLPRMRRQSEPDQRSCDSLKCRKSRGREAIKSMFQFMRRGSSKKREKYLPPAFQVNEAVCCVLALLDPTLQANDFDWELNAPKPEAGDSDSVSLHKTQLYVEASLQKLQIILDCINTTLGTTVKRANLHDSDQNGDKWLAVQKLISQGLTPEVQQALEDASGAVERERVQMQEEFERHMRAMEERLVNSITLLEQENCELKTENRILQEQVQKNEHDANAQELKYANLERYFDDQLHEIDHEREENARLEALVHDLKAAAKQTKKQEEPLLADPISFQIENPREKMASSVDEFSQTDEARKPMAKHTQTELAEENDSAIETSAKISSQLREEITQSQNQYQALTNENSKLRSELDEHKCMNQQLRDELDETNALLEGYKADQPPSLANNQQQQEDVRGLGTEIFEAEVKATLRCISIQTESLHLVDEEIEQEPLLAKTGFISPDSLSSDGAFSAVTSSAGGHENGLSPADLRPGDQTLPPMNKNVFDDLEEDPFNDDLPGNKAFPLAVNLGSSTDVCFNFAPLSHHFRLTNWLRITQMLGCS